MSNKRTIIGAIIGDIAGSTREGYKASKFTTKLKFFPSDSRITDDSVLTIAIADWLCHRNAMSAKDALLKWGNLFPHAGYGHGFASFQKTGESYVSTHNGGAMRVSPVGFFARSEEECLALATESAAPTHNTKEGTDGACAIALAVFLARTGYTKAEIRMEMEDRFGYDFSRRVKEHSDMSRAIRDGDAPRPFSIAEATLTVPQALTAFFESEDYESAVKLALSIGGDTDTIACMAGAVAAAFYGVPEELVCKALLYLPSEMIEVINEFEGGSYEPTGIAPPYARRWGREEHQVYACNADESVHSKAYKETIADKYNHHPLKPYPLHVLDADADTIRREVDALISFAKANPDKRFHVSDMGDSLAKAFAPALDVPNILHPASYVRILKKS